MRNLFLLLTIITQVFSFPHFKLLGRNLSENSCQSMTVSKDYKSAITACKTEISKNKKNIKNYLNLIQSYLKLQKNNEAFQTIQSAKKLNPDNPLIYLQLAELMENLGFEEESLSYMDRAIFKSEKNNDVISVSKDYSLKKAQEKEGLIIDIALLKKNKKNSDKVKIELCLMLFKAKDYSSAKVTCEEALKIDGNNSFLYFAKAMSLYFTIQDQSKKRIILEDMTKAYELGKGNVEAINNLGTFYFFDKEFEKALQFFNEALEINPLMIRALYNKAYVLLEMERFEESLKSFEEYEQIMANDTNSYYLKGFVFEKLGRLDEAIESYDQSLRIFPDNFNSLINKAYVLLKKGDMKEGRRLFKNIVGLEDQGFYDFYRSGPVLKIDSKYKGNLKCYSKSVLFDESILDEYIKFSDELRNVGKIELSILCLNLLKKKDENNSIIWKKMGDSLLMNSNFDNAEKNYDQAIKLNPKFVEAYLAKGVLYQKKRDSNKAQLFFQKGLDVSPENFKALNNLGYLQESRGNLDKAIEFYKKSLSQETSDGIALVNLGNAYLKKKENTLAIQTFQKALKDQKENPIIYKNLSEAYKNKGDYKKAFKTLNDGLTKIHLEITLLNSKAVLFQELKIYNIAIKIFETITKIDPNYTPAYNSIGVINQTMGDKKKAHFFYNRAIEIDPYFALSFNNKGFLFYNDKMYKEAGFFLDKAIMIDPKYSTAYNNRGLVFFKTKEFKKAVEYFRKAIELNKDNKSARKNLRFALKRV